MKKLTFRRILQALSQYAVFFLMVAFVVSCCMMLFMTTLADTMGIVFTAENVSSAAKMTFGNVLLISFLFVLGDHVRRKRTVDAPVKKITDAAKRIMRGDFSVRISSLNPGLGNDGFNQIIECFNAMASELAGTETLRTDFVANVSHELKTPLAVMQNYGTLLQQPELSEEKRMEYASAITDSSRRLAELITNILKLNRLENQQIFPETVEFDLSEQLVQSLLLFEDAWERKNIGIEAEIPDGITGKADPNLLELVWNNLLSNAMKFTPEGGSVTLSLDVGNDNVVVRVSDTGCGMKPEVGQHIFEKFYQGDTSHATQGNGLGLALVKRVVDILQGEISVQSVFGQGSTFTVKIRRESE